MSKIATYVSKTYDKPISIAIACLICNELVDLTENEEAVASTGRIVPKVCDKCKQAVMKMRKTL